MIRRFWLPALVALLAFAPLTRLIAEEKKSHSAVNPVPRDQNWKKRHDLISERVKAMSDAKLVFIGDSITQGWEGNGKEVWAQYYTPRKTLNLGIGGDRTQHVLWRLENGNLEGIKPQAAVIMIGTNNSNGKDNTAAEIADGITAIVHKLRKATPDTKILVLAVFPRGEKPNAQREKIDEVNKTVSKLDDGEHVFYLDIGANLMNPDGVISKEIMPDFLHLSKKGYEIWAQSIDAKVKSMLGEK
ncbi:MAG: platelet-activating factor acetylhydrolase IB subunit [Phycisphaeraceae bacterium]